jgi:hypothetical protein
MAHRVVYELLRNSIQEGMQLDHLCRVTACVNPMHLEEVTPRVNTIRSFSVTAENARKALCLHGHALEGDNLATAFRFGWRRCKTCHRDKMQAYRDARRSAEKLREREYLKTHCSRGHLRSESNTIRRANGGALCRQCNAERCRIKRALTQPRRDGCDGA